ncbi:response regulator transcription factor [Afipia sp. GAS231]|uniref:LuxR C-terminal-related transcriptional regulator n=1 Tax=Afipia sp. GAS231 TaxID=1882747 RepID=UPI00087A4180|nr:response regulator transcription factor [Afipia sp. GAS231]SDP25538.1 two component transcriptional regulator, LuxR family [Afipia sp. GAS231]
MSRHQSFATVLIGKRILVREGIARILRAANFRTSASVSCADDLPPGKLLPRQLLFLIVHAGDDIDVALDQIELLRDTHPGGRIAIVADHYRLDDVASAFRAGVNGYFVDIMTCDLFTKSVELVAMGETIFPPAFLTFALAPERLLVAEAVRRNESTLAILSRATDTIAPQLSPREQSILQCLTEGYSNKCIARKIDIAEATVKVHVKAILRKIRVQNRTQAAVWGMNNGSSSSPASSSAVPSTVDAVPRNPTAIEAISAFVPIAPPASPGVINSDANHVEVPRLDHLTRKSINRRTNGTNGMARLQK